MSNNDFVLYPVSEHFHLSWSEAELFHISVLQEHPFVAAITHNQLIIKMVMNSRRQMSSPDIKSLSNEFHDTKSRTRICEIAIWEPSNVYRRWVLMTIAKG